LVPIKSRFFWYLNIYIGIDIGTNQRGTLVYLGIPKILGESGDKKVTYFVVASDVGKDIGLMGLSQGLK
jgi:hypothetical protein